MAISKNCFAGDLRMLTSSKLLTLGIVNALALLFARLIAIFLERFLLSFD